MSQHIPLSRFIDLLNEEVHFSVSSRHMHLIYPECLLIHSDKQKCGAHTICVNDGLILHWKRKIPRQIHNYRIVMLSSVTNGTEDIYHFILDCDKLTEVRNTIYSLQRPYEEDKNQTLKEFLFNEGQDEENMERRKIQLLKLWKTRKRALKELQENSNDAQSALSAPRPSSHTSPPSNPTPTYYERQAAWDSIFPR